MNLLMHNKPVNWEENDAKHTNECLEYFIEMKWCKRFKNFTTQYKHLLIVFNHVNNDREKILDMFFNNDFEFLQFVYMHSLFSVNPKKDWLERYMINKLHLSDKTIEKLIHPDPVPQELLNKIKCFNPVQVTFEMHPITIEYGMWKRDHNNRIINPVHLTYLNWEFDVVTPADVATALAEYENISSEAVHDDDYDWAEDLPF